MFDVFYFHNPVIQALLAGLFTWSMTSVGSATVFMARKSNPQIFDVVMGFAGGVMLAASYWSLLAPAIEMSAGRGVPLWAPAVVGFLAGGLLMRATESVLPYLHIAKTGEKYTSGRKATYQSSLMLILAITTHNIPEGLAVGVAFGSLAIGYPSTALAGAIGLAIGIGIQNLPEGMAVSLPLRREGLSPLKSFFYGQLSGAVEPIFAVLGAAAVLIVEPVLPYALALAAGAMVFVVAEEVIPKAQSKPGLATIGLLAGFALMMALDVGLGST